MWNTAWQTKALCGGQLDSMFSYGRAQSKIKKLCESCPVRTECLATALDQRLGRGVWGGLTARDRKILLRKHSGVPSWRRLLEPVREQIDQDGAAALTLLSTILDAMASS